MRKRAFIIFATLAILLTNTLCSPLRAASETGNETAVRTILLWAGGADMDNPYYGPIVDRLNKMMDAEIPDSVNIIVLTGGNEMGWKEDLSLEGAESIRTDCNQVWKMKGSHDGQRGALALLEEDGLPGFEQSPMSDPATLKAFIDYGAANWPAEKYDLILIQHGSGPSGWGKDDVFFREDGKLFMSIDEICGALKESAVDRFDFLCFYACLMGSVEDAVMFSPYADTLIMSEENLPVDGIEFSGMLEMLRKDPRTDSFLLGRRIVDDTIDTFNGSDLSKTRNATLSAISTKNLTERLVPEMKTLTEILYREATQANENGEYAFYDELHSVAGSVEFGTSFTIGYQLYDLGNVVTALGIAQTEFDSASDIRELTNAYTDVSVRIMNILNDRDGSGDDVLYSRDTDSIHRAAGAFYMRDAEGKLTSCDSGFLKTYGLSIFFDRAKSWYPVVFHEAVEKCIALGDLDETSAAYLKRYADTMMLYSLIQGAGRAVYELEGRNNLTTDDLESAWEKLGIAVWDNDYTGGLFPNAGLKDIRALVRSSGFDPDPWLEKIAAQQAAEIINSHEISIRRKEARERQDTAGSYRLVSEILSARQLDGLYLRVKMKADYPFNGNKMLDYSGEYVTYGDQYLNGYVSPDLLMPALFMRENGGDFYRLVYGNRTALEIGLYDGNWYVLKDADGNASIVQIWTAPGNPNHVQVPVNFTFDEEKYGRAVSSGMLEFYLSSEEETPAAGFVPMMGQYAFGEGSQPLNCEMFSGSTMNTFGKLSSDVGVVELGPPMTPDGSESGGFTLARIPVKDIDVVRDVRAEYYLRDIYGNELELADAITAAEKEPLLKNLAFAEAKTDSAAVTVTCGDETLEEDRNYMVYTKDGEMLIQGIGEYAGSIVLNEED